MRKFLLPAKRKHITDPECGNSVYSAYEHSLLASSTTTPPTGHFSIHRSLDPKVNLPLDITLETLFSAFLLCVGVVLSSPGLKPIQWNVWAGELERSKEAREMKEVGVGGGNPYAGLEDRMGFWDVRAARKRYLEWSEKDAKS